MKQLFLLVATVLFVNVVFGQAPPAKEDSMFLPEDIETEIEYAVPPSLEEALDKSPLPLDDAQEVEMLPLLPPSPPVVNVRSVIYAIEEGMNYPRGVEKLILQE